jgi:hypothetical protein
MADTVRVVGRVHCPRCDLPLLNSARFRWGAVPGWTSDLGSESVWARDAQDRPYLPFIIVFIDGQPMWNNGDPRCRHVILLDEDVYGLKQELICHECNSRVAAVICTVRDGFYREMYALEEDEVADLVGASIGKASVIVVRDDGSYWPREDWWDGPLDDLRQLPEGTEVTIPLSEVPWLTVPDASR